MDRWWRRTAAGSGCREPCVEPPRPSAGCRDWESSNLTCFACLMTSSTAPRYGALINFPGPMPYSLVNFPGCIALAEPCNLPCAEAALADMECDLVACDLASGPCAGASSAIRQSCIDASDTSCGCAGYHASQNCYQTLLVDPSSHPAVSLCGLADLADFGANFTAVATFMCGPPG